MSVSHDATGTDLTVSLPTDTGVLSAVVELTPAMLEGHHLLVLADDVTADEVEALALSQDEHAAWVSAGCLQLVPGVQLEGPWVLNPAVREEYELPSWAASVMRVQCPPQRAGALPPELAGSDPFAQAFPVAQPAGLELLALTRVRSIARRLAGALLLDGDVRRVLIQPDPCEAVDARIYAPIWLTPDACQAVVAPLLADAAMRVDAGPDIRAGYVIAGGAAIVDGAASPDVDRVQDRRTRLSRRARRGRHAGGRDIEVRVEACEYLPIAVRGEAWANEGVIVYHVDWCPPDPAERHTFPSSSAGRHAREQICECIDRVAGEIARVTGGRIVDEDGFLIATS